MTRSSWDETRAASAYHFDTTVTDPRWDTVVGLGYITPTWRDEVAELIESSRAATWADRGYKGEGVEVPPEDLAAEEYDLERAGVKTDIVVSHLTWKLTPTLQRIVDSFAFKDVMHRIHVQIPGELWNLHIDKLKKWCPEDPSCVMRVLIQLTDWQPGQFWEFGNYHWNRWSAGDVATFDWRNVPHSTANAGHHPRVTLQLTGVVTEETQRFLGTLMNSTYVTV